MASQVKAEEAKLAEAQKELAQLEAVHAELAADLALMGASFLPPPAGTAADVVSLGKSLWTGDWGGALLDAVGFVPLVGDGLKAAGKGGKLIAKIDDLAAAIKAAKIKLARATKLTELRKAAAMKYWDDIRTKGRKAYDEAIKSCTTQPCKDAKRFLLGDQYKLTPVNNGVWKNGARGDGVWIPDPGSKLSKNLNEFSQNPKLNPSGKAHTGIPYKNGHPDYSEFVVPAGKGKAQVEIIQSGKNNDDFKAADEALSAATGKTKAQLEDEAGTKLTWHHHEDGVTMQLIPQNVHGAVSGSGHAGGASMVQTQEF